MEFSTITTAPSPADSGLTLEVAAPGDFPDPTVDTFHILAHAPDVVPDLQNAELVRIVGGDGTPWDIERAQTGSTAQSIAVGWYVWWDELYPDPLDLLRKVASDQLALILGAAAADAAAAVSDVAGVAADVVVIEEKIALIKRTVYTSGSGTHTYDTDAVSIRAIVCGGGGGGGSAPDDGAGSTAGSGGGAGGVAQKMFSKGSDTSCTYTVGEGGSASNPGDTSTVDPGAAANIVGNGGSGGVNGASSPSGQTGGAGGTATGGDMNSTGQAGSCSLSIGSAHAMSGSGGTSVMGGGGTGGITITSGGGVNGGAGGNYGGGGGGAAAGGTTTRTGGSGGDGVIIIEEYGTGV